MSGRSGKLLDQRRYLAGGLVGPRMRSLAPLTRGDVTGAKGTGGGDPRSVGDESSGTGGGIGQPWPLAPPRGSCVCVCVCVRE